MATWELHFREWFGEEIICNDYFIDVRDPYLDSAITEEEVISGLRKHQVWTESQTDN